MMPFDSIDAASSSRRRIVHLHARLVVVRREAIDIDVEHGAAAAGAGSGMSGISALSPLPSAGLFSIALSPSDP